MSLRFDEYNIKLNYLSPYTDIKERDNVVYFYNSVFNTYARIECNHDVLGKMISLLKYGAEDDVIMAFFTNELKLSSDDYYYFVQKGIIV